MLYPMSQINAISAQAAITFTCTPGPVCVKKSGDYNYYYLETTSNISDTG